MSYLIARNTHIACVVLSLTLFLVRGVLRFSGVPGSERPVLRAAPHAVDTVLLASAVWLAFMTHQYPLQQDWLTAKVVGLVVYVVLGSVALRPRRTLPTRIAAFLAALLTAAWIVSVAVTRNPLGFLA